MEMEYSPEVNNAFEIGKAVEQMLETYIVFDPTAKDVHVKCASSDTGSSAATIVMELAEFFGLSEQKNDLVTVMTEKIYVPFHKPEDKVTPYPFIINVRGASPILVFALSRVSNRCAIYWNDNWYLFSKNPEQALLDFNPKIIESTVPMVEKMRQSMKVLKWLYWVD